MLKIETNKITKQDIEAEIVNALEHNIANNINDYKPNKIHNALYCNRNYVLDIVNADVILVNGETNLMQMKDLPKTVAHEQFLTKDTTQTTGKLTFERVKVTGTCNVLRKKDLTIEKFKPIIQNIYDTYMLNNITYLPIGAYYVSDKNPKEILRGEWELKTETEIGKIWERIK